MKIRFGIAIIAASITASSRKPCENFYLIEEDNGIKVESYLGEFCEDEIASQEKKEFVARTPAHAECR